MYSACICSSNAYFKKNVIMLCIAVAHFIPRLQSRKVCKSTKPNELAREPDKAITVQKVE